MTLIEQYHAAKERHPNMLLLLRCGDFYELFGEDAEIASKILGLTLTSRDRTLSMAGFPHHQMETYLHRLLKAGQRVAICEQVESPSGKVPGEVIPVDAEGFQPTLFNDETP
jgi:DNA mismatch repair protein MutS